MALLEVRNLSKTFAGSPGVIDVNLSIQSGEIHALIGANGAGKSTLMKLLSGAYQGDQGEIYLNGQRVVIENPVHGKELGIHCVYQEVDTALVPSLTVGENLFLDCLPLIINWKTLFREAEEVLQKLNFPLDPKRKIDSLTLVEKQMVLLAKAFMQNAKIMIFDEPTAPLSGPETKILLQQICNLKEKGVGIIFISHRLQEVFALCDTLSVLRNGQLVLNRSVSATSPEVVVEAMFGEKRADGFVKKTASVGDPLLQANHLSDGGRVKDVTFQLRKGEILGIAGLVGAGKTELARLLFAASPRQQGDILWEGNPMYFSSPKQAIEAGFALVPEERRGEGLFVNESIRANLTLPILKTIAPWGWIRRQKEREHGQKIVDALSIKASHLEFPVERLSGGNQQKVVIGKWVGSDTKVLLLDEPTKGIDVQAKKELFYLLEELVAQGISIVYFTSEMDELAAISDTIYILYKGHITKKLGKEEMDPQTILYYASGGTNQDETDSA